MSIENKPAIVIDTGSSIRNDSALSKEYPFTSASLNINFFENGNWVTYEDTDLTPEQFYQKMKSSSELPKTSGAIFNKLVNIYDSNTKEEKSTISIHITSKHSEVYNSALLAKNEMSKKYPQLFNKSNPHLLIEVIDSKQVSIPVWFLAKQAISLAEQGCPLKDIIKITLETVPKTEVFTSLSTFENVVKGGRLSSAAGFVSSKLNLRPIVGIENGELKKQGLYRSDQKVREAMVKRVENTANEIIELAIVHTNFPEAAKDLKEMLSKIYSGKIDIFEAGPVLGVHAGEKGLGIALQKT